MIMMKATVDKIQTTTIVFVYAIILIAFFYINGIKTTGRTIETVTYSYKWDTTILISSAIVVIAIGFLIFRGRKQV